MRFLRGPSADEAAGLVEQGIALSRAGDHRRAERVLERACSAAAGADPMDRDAQRLYVKACWRLSMVQHASGKLPAALRTGRTGLYVGRRLMTDVPLSQQAELAEEVGLAAVDLAEAAFAAGLPEEAFRLLDEAVEWTGRYTENDRGPRKVYGTALHNKATGVLNQVAAGAAAPEDALRAAGEALRARTRLRLDSDPLSVWELANTRLLHVRAATVAGQTWDAVQSLGRAVDLLPPLGMAGVALESQARSLAQMLEQIAPGEVARQRRTGSWPGQRRR